MAKTRLYILAALLLSPALLVCGLMYFAPVFGFLFQGIARDNIQTIVPQTLSVLTKDSLDGPVPSTVYGVFFKELASASRPEIATLSRSISTRNPDYRNAVFQAAAAARAEKGEISDFATWFRDKNEVLVSLDFWKEFKSSSARFTSEYLLATAPWKKADSEFHADYSAISWRTAGIAIAVSILCLGLGFPVAYILSYASKRLRLVVAGIVLLSFWTSMLVRTLSWIIFFQKGGLLSTVSMLLGSNGIDLLHTQAAVIIGMIHILLPFMIFSLVDGMKKIPISQYRAALSLGATPVSTVLKVYLPQLRPAVSAGLTMVFTLTVGFYLTPLLLGGPRDQLLSYYVAFAAQQSGDWHTAAALSIWLLVIVASAGLLALLLSRLNVRGTQHEGR